MMKKKQAGQAFILVLILLAIGALLVVPTLRLTDTILGSTQTITGRNRGLYAATAAQELVMWRLFYGDLVTILPNNGDSEIFTVDVCGTSVDVSVVMRAVELEGGVSLATEHTIMPMKEVDIQNVDDPSQPGRIFTYTIILDQVSIDNTNLLLAVYDILPIDFGKTFSAVYRGGSSKISDNGEDWDIIPDPSYGTAGNQLRLRWPYTGNFAPDFGQFEPAEVKYLRFSVNDTLTEDDNINCNWVVLRVGDGINPENDVFTVSGPQASITVGEPGPTEGCDTVGVFEVYKCTNEECEPEIIPPLEPTDLTYTIHITNMDGFTRHIERIVDYLPGGFEYIGPTSGITDQGPTTEEWIPPKDEDSVGRWRLTWENEQISNDSIGASEHVTLNFGATATQGISGTYYNEVLVQPQSLSDIKIFTDIDDSLDIWDLLGNIYSWNSGTVIVPAYDSEADAEGVTIDANLALEMDGVKIISWHVD